jgi:hypothetical protein
MEIEGQIAPLEIALRIAEGLPCAFVPKHYSAAAVLALWNGAFKGAIIERVIFNMDRKAFVCGVEAR